MSFTPPEYPTQLTHAYWNKKKGLLARMKNDVETGIGDAADAAKEKFKKIEWDVFDIVKQRPAGNGPKALQQLDLRLEWMKTEWTKSIKPTIEALKTLGTKAKDAAPELTKAKNTDAAKAALEISKEAGAFALSLQMNSEFFTDVLKKVDKVRDEMGDTSQSANETTGDAKVWLKKVLSGLQEVIKVPLPSEGDDPKVWREQWTRVYGTHVKQSGRSLCNVLKTSDQLKKHLPVWTNKFNGFDEQTMPHFKGNLTPAEMMSQSKKLLADVMVEAKILQKDL